MKIICTYCKKEIPEHAQACPFCGAPVQPAVPAAPVFSGRPEAGHQPPLPNSYPQQPAVPPQVSYEPQAPYVPEDPQNSQAPYTPQQPNQAPYAGQSGQVLQQPGYGYAPQFAPGSTTKQISKKKVRWIVLGSIAGFLVVAGVVLAAFLGWYNAPIQVYERAMEAGDYETAALQLDSLEDADRLQAIDRFTKLAEKAYEDYNRGAITYEEAEELIKTLTSHCRDSVLSGFLQDLKRLRQSKMNFAKAVEAEEKGEDTEAFSYYNKVVEDDLQYEVAQEKVIAFCQSYKQDLLLEVEAYDAQGDYEAAANALEQSLEILNGDEEIYDLIGEYEVKAWKKQKEGLGFTAEGKFKTMEGYVQSDVVQLQLKSLREMIDSDIMEVEISGQENKLIYTYIYKEMYDVDEKALGEALRSYLDDNDLSEKYTSMTNLLKTMVEVENPVIVLQYITEDGTELCSKEYRGS